MSSSTNRYDAIEGPIFENDLKIREAHFYPDMDLMLIVLNNQYIFRYLISQSTHLKHATLAQLRKYELVGKGYEIYWPEVDEDLSLKELLKPELTIQLLSA